MNILVATDIFFYDDPGGGARGPWEISRNLVKRGHRVTLLSRLMGSQPTAEVREGVEVIRFPWKDQNFWFCLRNGIRTTKKISAKVDALHLHQPLPGLAVLLSRKFKRAPRLYFFYSPWEEEYQIRQRFHQAAGISTFLQAWLRKRIERFVLNRSNNVMVLSQFMMDRLRAIHAVPPHKISCLKGAVDTERFRPVFSLTEARRQLQWPVDKTILLTVRNLEPRMGLENLIHAIKLLPQSDLHLYIVGRGSLRDFLESKVRNLELESAVTFLGMVPDQQLPLMYQAADVFVLPTRELEGFGLVTVEALASGCPVVATPIGATPEILNPLNRTWLTKGTSPDDISEALSRFLQCRDQWPFFRDRCAQYAREKYSWQNVVDQVEKATMELIFPLYSC